MKTITELMKDVVPGSLVLENDMFPNDGTLFRPYYKDKDGDWRGVDDMGYSRSWVGDNSFWIIHVPEPRTETHWLWADPAGYISRRFHPVQPWATWFKLEWSATEFEVIDEED